MRTYAPPPTLAGIIRSPTGGLLPLGSRAAAPLTQHTTLDALATRPLTGHVHVSSSPSGHATVPIALLYLPFPRGAPLTPADVFSALHRRGALQTVSDGFRPHPSPPAACAPATRLSCHPALLTQRTPRAACEFLAAVAPCLPARLLAGGLPSLPSIVDLRRAFAQ